MKCDRYIGTGATNTHKELSTSKSAVTSCRPIRPLRSVKSDASPSYAIYSAQTGVTEIKNGNLQVPTVNFNRPTETPSPARSSVLINDALSDCGSFNSTRKDEFEGDSNRCIVIEMRQIKKTSIEVTESNAGQDNEEHVATSIKDYEVIKIIKIDFV